jgi:GNAT superfamily N-acetyltransferase
MMEAGYSIADFADHPDLVPTASERIWTAWWQGSGQTAQDVDDHIRVMFDSADVPFALVALRDGAFAGVALAIASDMDERPQYSPWVAALWVDPEHRGKGVAAALVETAVQRAFGQGHETVYLCSQPSLRDLYLHLGWQIVEEHAGANDLIVYSRTRPSA